MRKTLLLVCAALLVSAPAAVAQIDTVTVCDVQDGTVVVGSEVFIDSLIVTAIDLKPSTFGFFVQQNRPCKIYADYSYSGVMVYCNQARPDTMGNGVGLEIGDLVQVRGFTAEYPSGGVPSVTEIDGATDLYSPWVKILTEDYGEPTPVLLSCQDLGVVDGDSTFCEKWEGVLCKVDTVIVPAESDTLLFDQWGVVENHIHPGADPTSEMLWIGPKLFDPTPPPADTGQVFCGITGVFSYEYGNYKMWARRGSDYDYCGILPPPHVVVAYAVTDTRIYCVFDQAIDPTTVIPGNFSLLTVNVNSASLQGDQMTVTLTTDAQTPGTADQVTACNIENTQDNPMPQCESYPLRLGVVSIYMVQTPDSADASQYMDEQVTTTGRVSSGPGMFGNGFYLQHPAGGERSGVFVFDTVNHPTLGDSVIVSAGVSEYYGKTEIYLPNYVSGKIGIANRVPEPEVLDIGILTTPSPGDTAEYWEGVLVKLNQVRVVDAEFGFTVHRGADSCGVGYEGNYTYWAVTGDSMNVSGPLDFVFNVWTIEPRDSTDIDVYFYAGVEEGGTPLQIVSEFRNYPNPFNPKTVVKFGITAASDVRLAIYDVNGRLVRTLMDAAKPAGTYEVLWNGNDGKGRATAAGVYYCVLEAGDRVETTKLVLVK